jgi:septal ring factor EnvC (AmiA/AmiB activator)
MTTLTDTGTSIEELENALKASKAHEQELALEVDELPSKIQQAHREDAQRKAQAAREGGAGAEVAAAGELSQVPALRQREGQLPYLRWSQSVRTAAIEVELHGALEDQYRLRYQNSRVLLPDAQVAADEAAQRLSKIRSEVHTSERGADYHGSQSRLAEKRLASLEAEYPRA